MTTVDQITANAKILVVDDDRVSTHVVSRMLEHAGYRHIWTSHDPTDGLALFREVLPDLVLVDLHMEPFNGLELIRRIHEGTPAAAYVPVIVISGDESDEARLNALVLGAKDFIRKPIDQVESMLRIRIWLETRFRFLEMEETIERLKGPYGKGSPTRFE